MAHLTFLGATGEVTGSRYLIETERSTLLLECGLYQGGARADRQNRKSLRRLARNLDAVILSHAHLDHAGLLPKLVADGFRGTVHCTRGTRDLLEIMLRDAAHVMAKDVEWENKRRERAGRKLVDPLYTLEDVEVALELCEAHPYGRDIQVEPDVRLRFFDAGHILGAAIVELMVDTGGRRRHLVFSGDLGNADSVLMNDPARLDHADLVLLESTYGDRDHRPLDATIDELADVLETAHRDGGNVFIPAFAVGRTQELLWHIGMLHHAGRLPQQQIFLDSPMAIQVTELYGRLRHLLNAEDLEELQQAAGTPLDEALPQLQFTRTVEESMAINRIRSGAIVIAGAGMCNGGRILHHLKYNLWRPQAHIVIVGFQAQGTLGRMLVDGVERVKLLGEQVVVKAQVHTLGGFSAHAGQSQLMDWASAFRDRPVFHLVHGEPGARTALADALRGSRDIDARVPEFGDRIEI